MTMTEWEIRMSQAGIEPEEPIVEPWSESRVWAVRIIAFVASWALAAGAIYCLVQAYQALPSLSS